MKAVVPKAKVICGYPPSGEMYTDRSIVLYEYQKSGNSEYPMEFLRPFMEYRLRMVLSSIIKWAESLTES